MRSWAMRCDAMRHENAIQKPVGSPIEKQYQEGVNPSQLHAFFVSFFASPSILSVLFVHQHATFTTSEAPLKPAPPHRWRALGPSRLGARLGAHGSMASSTTCRRGPHHPGTPRDVKLYAQAGGPFVLDDDDPRRHFEKLRSTVSGFFGGKPMDPKPLSVLLDCPVCPWGLSI